MGPLKGGGEKGVLFMVAKKMDYPDMHGQECSRE